MDSNISVLENTNCTFNDMVEGELLQVNGGKEVIVAWLIEQLIEKTIELGYEVGKKVYSSFKSNEGDSDRSHSSGGMVLPKYDPPQEVGIDWRI